MFNHSFDTLSDHGGYLREVGHSQESADGFSITSPACSERPIHGESLISNIDMGLPHLDQHESDCSLGDISPIKDVNRGPTATHFHLQGKELSLQSTQAADSSNQYRNLGIYHHYPQNGHDVKEGDDYRYGNYGEGRPHISNPFFVIRSCQRAFEGCRFLLPCLREGTPVPVNLSQYGHIRHYQDPEVSEISISFRPNQNHAWLTNLQSQ